VPDPDFGMVPDELGAVVLPEDAPWLQSMALLSLAMPELLFSFAMLPLVLDEPLPLVDLLLAEDDAPGPQSMLWLVADEPVVPAVPAVPGVVPVPVLPVPADVPAPPLLVCAIAVPPIVSAAIATAVRRRRLIDCSSLPSIVVARMRIPWTLFRKPARGAGRSQ